MTMGRIRVFVAGDIYVNRALVRPFLEDDGYEVVGEALTRDDVLPGVDLRQPDAVVIDDRFLSARGNGKLLQKVHRAAPEAKVVVVTSAAGRTNGIPGVDAYLENGMSLAALSATLGRLFASEDPRLALAAVGAAAVRPSAEPTRAARSHESRGVMRFVATVGTPVIVAWGLIAVLATGAGVPLQRDDRTDLGGEVVIHPQGVEPLDAHDALDLMIDAIEAGNYPIATSYARTLRQQRETAIAGGHPTAGLDGEIFASLTGLAAQLPADVASALQGILGDLFPTLESEETPGGGSDVVLGPVTGSGGSRDADTSTGRSETTGGGDTTGGGGEGDGDGGEGDGGGGIVVVLGPGDGRDWGQSHKLTKGDGGPPPWAVGPPPWAVGPPPWAGGNTDQTKGHRGDPPGHRAGHGNGLGLGLGDR